jgi:class 3 adenylate cyclase/tetratricopeptide (TPR) repeat protein
VRCASCGEENPDRARFCLACGSALEAPPAGAGEERKVVSVLFVDLVGFTAASDDADPEDVRARLRPYHAMLKREIERFGGTVEKFIGDAVMAVFGAPVAHEDDAERAVRAALRITEAIPELNAELPGLDLAVRAAVNTGEAVVTLGARPAEGEGFVTGDVVNTASRLQGAAPVGSVVAGEITHRATRDAIDYEELEPVSVKGKREPVPLWRALAARSRYGVDVERPRTPFVGREDDLSVLRQTYVRTLRESSVQLITVVGEPGVGKTRLVAEFQAFVDDRPEIVFWRQGRCLPYGEGITFWALGEIVKAQAGVLESDPPEEAGLKLAEAVDLTAQEADREWLKSRLAPLVGSGGSSEGAVEREEAFTAWRAFLEGIAAFRPLILVVEDLHWADEAMRAFLAELVDWSSGVPMLVLCTARPELYERDPGWGGGKRNSSTLSLTPLTGDDTARLIAALLDQAVLPVETQELLLERAGGNPLYTEEFVRMLVDRGLLERRGGVWTVAAGHDIPVPESVQALIAARLDTLTPERKALLQDASVIGKVFWAGAVAAMSGREPEDVRAGLHELARKELVRPARRASVAGEVEYAFWHLLIRDVAYGQIPRAGRAAKHRAAAEWIERMAGDRVEDHAEHLAHHYLQALELAPTGGDEADLLRAQAARFLTAAGDRTKDLDAGKAMAYLQRALGLLERGSEEWASAAMRLAAVAWFVGELDLGIGLAEEARALFEARGDVGSRAEIDTLLGGLLWQRGETPRARELLNAAIADLERLPESAALGEAYVRAAGNEMMSGEFVASRALAERGLPLVRRFGLAEAENRALPFIGTARCVAGDLGGLETMDLAVAKGKELGLGLTGVALVNRGDWRWELEGPAAALGTYEEAAEFAGRRRVAAAERWARAQQTWVLYDLGRWGDLLAVAEEVVAGDPATTQLTSLVLPGRVQVLAWRGLLEQAAAEVPRMLERARAIKDPQVLMPALSAGVLVAGLAGDAERAVDLTGEMADASRDRLEWRPYYLADALRALRRVGRVEAGFPLIGPESLPGPRGEYVCRVNIALRDEADGDLDAGAHDHAWLAEAWGNFGNVVERVHALLGTARCLVGLGRTAEAGPPLLEARSEAARLGAAVLVEEADELLGGAAAVGS